MGQHLVDKAVAACQRVRLARARLPISHQGRVVTTEHRGHERAPNFVEHSRVRRLRSHHAVEGEVVLSALIIRDADLVVLGSATLDAAAAALGHEFGLEVTCATEYLDAPVVLAHGHVEHVGRSRRQVVVGSRHHRFSCFRSVLWSEKVRTGKHLTQPHTHNKAELSCAKRT